MAATPLRFGIRFIIGFAALMGAFEASRNTAFEHFLVVDAILMPTTHLIDTLTPSEHVKLIDRTIASPGSSLRITRGCEGIEMFILLTAAIVAFPASLKSRLRGLFYGAILAYVLSISRLVGLHYALRYSPGVWETLHGLVAPLGPIVLLALFFMHWSATASRVAPSASCAT
jgi:exosortase family protein XrtM